eukprot:2993466-Rhodomonas_salina.1
MHLPLLPNTYHVINQGTIGACSPRLSPPFSLSLSGVCFLARSLSVWTISLPARVNYQDVGGGMKCRVHVLYELGQKTAMPVLRTPKRRKSDQVWATVTAFIMSRWGITCEARERGRDRGG